MRSTGLDFRLIGPQFSLGATSRHTPWPSRSPSPSHPRPRSRLVPISWRSFAGLPDSLSHRCSAGIAHADGVRAATTAVSARAAASLLALPPIIQPPQENPMTTDATAPTAIPCSKRVSVAQQNSRSLHGFCLSMRGRARTRRATSAAGADGTRSEWCSFDSRIICLPTASVLPMGEWRLRHVAFFGSSRTNGCPLTNNTRTLTLVPALE